MEKTYKFNCSRSNMKKTIIIFLFLMLVGFVDALSVDSVNVDTVSPGQEGTIRMNIENDGNKDVELVSLSLKFDKEGIIPVGSSEMSVDEIKEDDDENFVFRFMVANDLPVGTYSIQYTLKYEENNDEKIQTGVIGVVVSAEPEIEVVVDSKNPIINQQGQLNIRVVNKGLADARFVNLFIESEGITFLSEKSEYIGTIDSDDFTTSNFDVLYNNRLALIHVKIIYKDFNNQEKEILQTASIKTYTAQEAVEKGILKKSNVPFYAVTVFSLLLVWFVFRFIKKRRKKKD